jgi:hypothetical protein
VEQLPDSGAPIPNITTSLEVEVRRYSKILVFPIVAHATAGMYMDNQGVD